MSTEEGNLNGSADTQTDTTVDTGADKAISLRDNLEAHFELAEKGEEATDLSAAAKTLAGARKAKTTDAKVDAKADAKQDDPAAKRAAELAAMSPEDRARAEADDKAKAEAAGVEAPAHWPAADREMFGKQSLEAKQWLLKRHAAMEADYTRKTQELGSVRQLKTELDDIFKPFAEEMALNGITQPMAIRQLVAAHAMLQKDPASAMQRLAGQYGIDLKSLVEGAAAADPAGESPTVKALRQQVQTLTEKLTNFTGAQDRQQYDARLNEVTQFAEEKDAQGNLKRPYFDEVASEVALRLRAARESGQPISLQDAYDQAIYANPTTRQKVLAELDSQRRAKEEADRKAKADAAKKAGFDVKGEGAAQQGAATTPSLRDSLERHWDAAEGRV